MVLKIARYSEKLAAKTCAFFMVGATHLVFGFFFYKPLYFCRLPFFCFSSPQSPSPSYESLSTIWPIRKLNYGAYIRNIGGHHGPK